MIPNRRISGILLLCMLQMAAFSQSYPKTLLWRVSGYGLQKPSYLYGTMHLNDKRLFTFGDSVYNAIEQSAGLAIEINPDEMVAYMVNNFFDEMKNSRKLQQLLQKSDFKKYSSALEKKFNKSASEISAADIVKEKNKWMSEYMEKGEMPTFMDAYLYNMARRQGKWLGGIEDMGDQAGLMENMVDKSDIESLLAGESSGKAAVRDSSVNRMIDLYAAQDLEAIEAFANDGSTPEKRDGMLIRRNIKMARRMDSLMQLRTMFLAVGAAHLPGDSGIIYLLRKKGFTVDPVFSSRKIDVKNYTFKEVQIPWVEVADAQGLYQTMMPGNPANIKVGGLVDMKFLMDIFSMTGFCTMAIANPSEEQHKDSLYKNLSMRMFQTDKPLTSKNIQQNGIEGREYEQSKKGANLRLQLFFYHKVIYVSFMYAMKEEGMHSPDADRFFAALKMNEHRPVTSVASVFTDSIIGVRVVSPAPLTYNKQLSNNTGEGWKISAFSGSQVSTGSYILLFSKDVKPAHYLQSDSVIEAELSNNLRPQYDDFKTETHWLQGLSVSRLSGRNKLQPSLYMSAASVLLNGRNIVLLVVTDSLHRHSPEIDSLFTSLQFIPHPRTQWKNSFTPGNNFSSLTPDSFVQYTNNNQVQFYAYDTTTAISYNIIPDTLNKYFWVKSDSSYWKDRAADNIGKDSLVSKKMISNGNMPGIELLTREPSSVTRYKRTRLVQQDNKLYKLFVSAERDFLYTKNVDSFFTAFRSNTNSVNNHFITTPKTALVLTDLLSTDSATRITAFNWLNASPFTEQDREALQQALFRQYTSPYDTIESDDINYGIVKSLLLLDSNATTGFIKTAYGSFTQNKERYKNISLALLAKLHTKESYTALAALLQSPPLQPFDNSFTNALRDSLPLTAALYPSLQRLAADTLYVGSITNIANELVDSGVVKIDNIQAAEHDFIKAANSLLPALVKDVPMDYNIYELLVLLGKFNDAPSNKVLQSYLAAKSPWIRKRAALELIGNAQPVPAALLDKMAADKNMRIVLYNDLLDLKKKSLFPARYATQAYFAESNMYSTATEDGEMEITAMQFLHKKTAVYKKKTYLFYLYKITVEGDDGPAVHLGIEGGYPVAGAGLDAVIGLGAVYYDKTFDLKKIDTQLQEYLKKLEKDEADNDKTGTE
ncbi:MAG: TraB/GumN family protein [Chitinophagaceae bacterium]